MNNAVEGIVDFFKIIFVIPIIIIIMLLLVPLGIVLFIYFVFDRLRNLIKLKVLLRKFDGQVYLIYADYNNVDLSQFTEELDGLKHIKVVNNHVNGLLEQHLIKGLQTKNYPRLTKIDNGKVIHKEHYNSFKNLVKRNNDLDSFYELLMKSFNNLIK